MIKNKVNGRLAAALIVRGFLTLYFIGIALLFTDVTESVMLSGIVGFILFVLLEIVTHVIYNINEGRGFYSIPKAFSDFGKAHRIIAPMILTYLAIQSMNLLFILSRITW